MNSKKFLLLFLLRLVDDKISIAVVPISKLLSGDSLPARIKDYILVENEETQQETYKRDTWSRGVGERLDFSIVSSEINP